MDKVFRECGPGWATLIDPVEALITALGGLILQIKEKFGGLRLYYSPGSADEDARWVDVEKMVRDAESASLKTCEMCGKPGYTRSSGRWLKTLCDDHALELGYRMTA